MSWESDIEAFKAKLERQALELHHELEEEVFDSITEGSEVTGSKGQPVRTGTLKDSWEISTLGTYLTEIYTKIFYAPIVERSSNALKMTIAGWRDLVRNAVGRLR